MPSFKSMKELRGLVEGLPGPPNWAEVEVEVPGGTTDEPIQLFYRDGLECFQFLFSNPIYAEHMDYHPKRAWTDGDRSERVYTEIMTGDLAWEVQDQVGEGETLGLVVLG